jgi:hypothetical protein
VKREAAVDWVEDGDEVVAEEVGVNLRGTGLLPPLKSHKSYTSELKFIIYLYFVQCINSL